jgi:drug/metabolite transporter (DMT)-like permease
MTGDEIEIEVIDDEDPVIAQEETHEDSSLIPKPDLPLGNNGVSIPISPIDEHGVSRRRFIFGVALLVVVNIIWVLSSMITQYLFFEGNTKAPVSLTFLCNAEFIILLPIEILGIKAKLFRSSNFKKAGKIAILVGPIWFLAQASYNTSLLWTTVSSNTMLSSTSSIWTFLISIVFFGESFDKYQFGGVCLTITGAILVSYDQMSSKDAAIVGDILCLVSSLFYAIYSTLIKKKVPNDPATSSVELSRSEIDLEERVSIPLMFGFIGLFNAILFFPVIIALNYSGLENATSISLPFLALILLKGLLDNVLSDVLWSYAVVLTQSATIATIALSLTIPLSILVEWLKSNVTPSFSIFIGALAIILGFVITSLR